MEIVINESKMERHSVNKYKFKVFSAGAQEHEEHTQSYAEQQLEESPVAEHVEQQPVSTAAAAIASHRDELVESLLKKTDDVTSNFIKMQMKLEDMEKAHKAALEQATKEAFEQGVQAGREALQKEVDEAHANGLAQFAESVKTLETSAQTFEQALAEVLKPALMHIFLNHSTSKNFS